MTPAQERDRARNERDRARNLVERVRRIVDHYHAGAETQDAALTALHYIANIVTPRKSVRR